jgi:hypothetical protein
VELALGWQMDKWPLAGSGQAAEACEETKSANATSAKVILRMCRDGNFMTNGALKTENLNELDATGKSNSKAKLLLSEIRLSK